MLNLLEVCSCRDIGCGLAVGMCFTFLSEVAADNHADSLLDRDITFPGGRSPGEVIRGLVKQKLNWSIQFLGNEQLSDSPRNRPYGLPVTPFSQWNDSRYSALLNH